MVSIDIECLFNNTTLKKSMNIWGDSFFNRKIEYIVLAKAILKSI